MARNAREQVQEKPRGVIGITWHLITRTFVVLLLSLLFSIIIEWIGITWFWADEGVRHSQNMMMSEMGWLSNQFTQSLLHASPIQFAQVVISDLNETLFIKTGLKNWLNQASYSGDWQATLVHYTRAYLESVIYVTLTFIVRLLIIVFTLPLFLLAAVVGFTDGLVRRDLRRFGRGYESSFIYHNAKRMVVPVMFFFWALYLSLPFSFHPNWILMPAAILFGLSISIVSGSFKKYL